MPIGPWRTVCCRIGGLELLESKSRTLLNISNDLVDDKFGQPLVRLALVGVFSTRRHYEIFEQGKMKAATAD